MRNPEQGGSRLSLDPRTFLLFMTVLISAPLVHTERGYTVLIDELMIPGTNGWIL